jgi:alpha-amylase/alpha-mannosidase (GH57 family)
MTTLPSSTLVVHGHFYQPPREDPFTGRMPVEPEAAPYHDFNEKITAECYRPAAERGFFERLSFNIGPTLMRWMSRHAPDTYQRIVDSDKKHAQQTGVGNAIAQPVHHTILPLARQRDRVTQVRWGIASFRHRFGRQPRGMWLPEMAVDLETLEVLSEEGLSFTILSDNQVAGDLRAGSGPYRVRLPNGGYFAVFVRNRYLSDHIAFGLRGIGDARKWAAEAVAARPGRLSLIATDGETFGHHHPQGLDFLGNLLTSSGTSFNILALTDYLRRHPPTIEVDINPRTAWSCSHGVARWDAGCSCTPGDASWKPALRSAFDLLADEIDAIYLQETRRIVDLPWRLVDESIDVVLELTDMRTLVDEHAKQALTTGYTQRIGHLVQAQFYRQRMFASCGWFFEDLDRFEPRYVVANAARAIQLCCQATGVDLGPDFCETLKSARSSVAKISGADLYDEIASRAAAEPAPTVGGWLI